MKTLSIKDYTYDALSARWIVVWSDDTKTELSGYEKGWEGHLKELVESGDVVEQFGTPYRFPWEPLPYDAELEARKSAFAKGMWPRTSPHEEPTMSRHYVLNDRRPVPCEDLTAWSEQFEKFDNRIVARTAVGGALVSTVFLGIDHNFRGEGSPVLFETMVFGDEETCDIDLGKWRYCTWEEAEAGHQDVVARMERIAADASFPQ